MAEPNMAEIDIAALIEIEKEGTLTFEGTLIIEGIRDNGTKFRPSDWPERISSTFAVFGRDQRLRYAPGVCPRIVNGQKVLAVASSLQQQNPSIFHAVMKFARDNGLRTREEPELEAINKS